MNSIAVVTGGTRGIGLVIAQRLAAAGHRTIALGRTIPDGLDATVEGIACDIADPAAVAEVFAELGPVHVLVNNAGISSSNPIARTTDEEWQSSIAVNATGPFLCIRAVVGPMLERGDGRIVTVASTASLEGSRYTAAYTASKHAVLGLMRVLAAEVEGSGIVVGSVCPTFVRTPMTLATIENIAAKTGVDLATAESRLTAATPHGRILEIDEVADAVLDLIDGTDNGREVLLDGAPT